METHDNFATALAVDDNGYACIPLHPGTKVPLFPWKRWQTERPTRKLYRHWFEGTRNNIALVTTGMVLFDCDDPAMADVVIKHCGDTSHKVRTPNGGMHLGYRKRQGVEVKNLVRVKGRPLDIRTDGGLEVLPFSETQDGAYAWIGDGLVPIADLPVAKIGWTRERTRHVVRTIVIDDADSVVRRTWVLGHDSRRGFRTAGPPDHLSRGVCARAEVRPRLRIGLAASSGMELEMPTAVERA